MAAQHKAHHLGVSRCHFAQLDPKVDPRALPRQIADFVTKNLRRQRHLVARGGNGNHRIGMHMIDMGRGHKAVQPRVDRRGAGVKVEDAMAKRVNHRVFLIKAFVLGAQLEQLVHIQG